MNEIAQDASNKIRGLFDSQIQAVLATSEDGQPHTSLMVFAASADLKKLFFATYRNTHKYGIMSSNPKAAMLMDNRSGHAADHHRSIAVTAKGRVQEVEARDREIALELYTAKHPTLTEFVTHADCALMEMRVDRYYLVSEFYRVTELPMTNLGHKRRTRQENAE